MSKGKKAKAARAKKIKAGGHKAPRAMLDRGTIDFSSFVFKVAGDAFVSAKREERASTLPPVFTDLLKAPKPRDPHLIPPDAHSAPWEAFLEFLPGATKPRRIDGQLYFPDPPIAMRCPSCEVRQDSLARSGFSFFGDSGHHRCIYCGLRMAVVGTRLAWWR